MEPTIFEEKPEQAFLVALDTGEYDVEASLAELEELAHTAGAQVLGALVQKRESPDKATCLGSGRLEELTQLCRNVEADLVIFDLELTATQHRNLESELPCRVVDRTALILDIFAARARSAEGRLQVELAQLQYLLPRLAGQGVSLSRLGGGIGTRGPGETKLESDRRHIRRRIRSLRLQLDSVEQQRERRRERRKKDGIQTVAIVGYTNAGKSTLLNALTQAGVLAEDKLFATLDPTARKCTLPSGLQVILVDTVGFVSRLPHDLVDAFKSTLEEAACSDIILKIADASDSEAAEQLSVTDEVLNDLGCGDIPQVTVYNKCDRTGVAPYDPDVLLVSAKTGYGLDSLLAKIDEILAHRVRTIEVLLPYDKLALADVFRTRGSVLAEEYRENGVYYKATVKVDDLHRFEAYLL